MSENEKKVVEFSDYADMEVPEKDTEEQKKEKEKKHRERQRKKQNESVLQTLGLGKYKRK
jgi:hypothetical protein